MMNKLKTILAITISAFVILGVIFGWFLKPLNRMRNLQDLDRSDSQVFQQEQQVRQYENLTRFERRDEPPTKTEKEIIAEEQERLDELKKRRDKKREMYEQSK